ncbi:hypothetical protein C8Q75DRAFT_737805 [Abortiporus biennis]|nr:hypothetical protein C8Q75DRAFT_737805 [Abortiporus biennis]
MHQYLSYLKRLQMMLGNVKYSGGMSAKSESEEPWPQLAGSCAPTNLLVPYLRKVSFLLEDSESESGMSGWKAEEKIKPGDNPQQSDFASHIGGGGNCNCYHCKIGGNYEHTESNEGYAALFMSMSLEIMYSHYVLERLERNNHLKKKQSVEEWKKLREEIENTIEVDQLAWLYQQPPH